MNTIQLETKKKALTILIFTTKTKIFFKDFIVTSKIEEKKTKIEFSYFFKIK